MPPEPLPETSMASAPARKVPPGVLAGPIIPTMLRLASPTIVVLVVQTLVGVAETYFISFLGTDALAGVTLVFPVVAPVYGADGLGLALYFASQGAKRVLLPVLAGTVRMIIAAFIGRSAVTWFGAGLSTLFQIVALASVVYGALTAVAVLVSWGRRPANQPLAQAVVTK